jgi:hypothetical protein
VQVRSWSAHRVCGGIRCRLEVQQDLNGLEDGSPYLQSRRFDDPPSDIHPFPLIPSPLLWAGLLATARSVRSFPRELDWPTTIVSAQRLQTSVVKQGLRILLLTFEQSQEDPAEADTLSTVPQRARPKRGGFTTSFHEPTGPRGTNGRCCELCFLECQVAY